MAPIRSHLRQTACLPRRFTPPALTTFTLSLTVTASLRVAYMRVETQCIYSLKVRLYTSILHFWSTRYSIGKLFQTVLCSCQSFLARWMPGSCESSRNTRVYINTPSWTCIQDGSDFADLRSKMRPITWTASVSSSNSWNIDQYSLDRAREFRWRSRMPVIYDRDSGEGK